MVKSFFSQALCLACAAWSAAAHAQLSNGSDGSDGALLVDSNQTLALPPDGIFNFTTVTIETGATLSFQKNALNTPVYFLATGDIVVDGAINLRGQSGDLVSGGAGGPGGFAGGPPSIAGNPAGSGLGPGAGAPAAGPFNTSNAAGKGSYGSRNTRAVDGPVYGSELLVPLVGGSGGGGSLDTRGGCGGGGAILLASDTRVEINGDVFANVACDQPWGVGSGGGVRIVAPVVAGLGEIWVNGGDENQLLDNRFGGRGRVRIDVIDRSELANLVVLPSQALSVGAFFVAFPDTVPRLDIISAAGNAIAEGTQGPVDLVLPLNSPSAQTIVVQGRDFQGTVPITVAVTPDTGDRVLYEAEIDMSAGNPATVNVPVDIPANVPVRISAWSR